MTYEEVQAFIRECLLRFDEINAGEEHPPGLSIIMWGDEDQLSSVSTASVDDTCEVFQRIIATRDLAQAEVEGGVH